MIRRVAAGLLVIALALAHAVSGAAEGNNSGENDRQELVLSQRFQRVIAGEMNAVQKGMHDLTSAIPAGRWDEIIAAARGMIDGYIIKKKLSEAEQAELEQSLPEGYRDIDREFRGAAVSVVHGAGARDMKAVNEGFYRLGESCIACHVRYAGKRFPGLHQK